MRALFALVVALGVALGIALGACGAPPERPPVVVAPPPPPPQPVVAPPAAPLPSSPGPLGAAHAALGCLDCHVADLARIDDRKCVGCHTHQDLAARIASGRGFHASAAIARTPCEACHHDHRGVRAAQIDWSVLPGGQAAFDHDLTGWPLGGAHRTARCDDCHKAVSPQGERLFAGTDRQCGTCHANDNPHGPLRRTLLACERCHSEAVWTPVKAARAFNHDDFHDARMPLLGVHADVPCVKCHPKDTFNLKLADPIACDNCHKSPHANTIKASRPCAECHSPTFAKFTVTNFDHLERTHFDLGASHKQLACAACHSPARGATAPSPACETCHAARSPHKDRFKDLGAPPPCAECHQPTSSYNPRTPTVRAPWKVGSVNHERIGHWRMIGKHASLGCRACHRGSTPADFAKLAPFTECLSCHKAVHAEPAYPAGKYANQECTKCHRIDTMF